MQFTTNKTYDGRPRKIEYVYDKYQPILKNSILDVGADECHMKKLIGEETKYVGIGIGGNPDIEVNLETQTIPFEDNSFECVMCLDVLEHLDNIHGTFDELCRVSSKYVIISLPNSYRDFLGMMFAPESQKVHNFKYYGLPVEKPDDRHKWFFSNSDAINFVTKRGEMQNMKVVQIDTDNEGKAPTFKSALKRFALRTASTATCVKSTDLYHKTMWALLEKQRV